MRAWQSWQIYKTPHFANASRGKGTLYVRGVLPKSDAVTLAVVGSRRISEYGRNVIAHLIPPLAANGVVIVSGFMYGVDVAAHSAALDAGGVTVAVLGSGLNEPCPTRQDRLYSRILEQKGAVVSQFKPEEKAQRWMFPRRNSIIAALSRAVLVVEAAKKSGSFITVAHALDSNTPVLSVPGSIFSSVSEGANELIRLGAIPVTSAYDVASVLDIELKRASSQNKHRDLFGMLQKEPQSIDTLSRVLQKPLHELSAQLTLLTLEGTIIEREGKYYATSSIPPKAEGLRLAYPYRSSDGNRNEGGYAR